MHGETGKFVKNPVVWH